MNENRGCAVYTHQGMTNLGLAVVAFRSQPKSWWNPVRCPDADLLFEERTVPWSQGRLAKIIEREFGLEVTQSTIARLENQSLKVAMSQEILTFLYLLASLEIARIGDRIYTDADLLRVAREELNWETGERLAPRWKSAQLSCCNSSKSGA